VANRGLAVAVASLALALGCGDDDQEENGGPAPGPTQAHVSRCLADAELELRPGSEPFTDKKGRRKTRQGLDIAKTTYLGYVQWPNKRVADLYLTDDEAAAAGAERKAEAFVSAFGLEPGKYVRREANLVLLFDDPPPTAEDVEAVLGCAGGS
jgi:hypothetical protein